MLIQCTNCHAYVEAEKTGGYEYPRLGDDRAGRYLLLKCARCFKPSLVVQENVGNMAEGDIWDAPISLYPSSDLRVNPKAPSAIRAALEEALACYRGRAYTATAIMCRKTLEGVCEAHGIRERNLMAALRAMRDGDQIDERLMSWSDALRLAGNEAAHGVATVFSKEDAQDMLEFTSAIIDYLFSYRDQFEGFLARRAAGAPRT